MSQLARYCTFPAFFFPLDFIYNALNKVITINITFPQFVRSEDDSIGRCTNERRSSFIYKAIFIEDLDQLMESKFNGNL
jgi:hypothetical protein